MSRLHTMSRKGWKQVERTAAALMGSQRYPANTGDRLDFGNGGSEWVGQVKSVKRISFPEIERLALECERLAGGNKFGALILKRSAGKGTPTPHLVVVTETTWRRFLARGQTKSSTPPSSVPDSPTVTAARTNGRRSNDPAL